MGNPTFTPIQGQPNQFLKQEIVQTVDLDPAIAVHQKVIDDSSAGILEYQERIVVLQGQILAATQARDAIVALKTTPVIIP